MSSLLVLVTTAALGVEVGWEPLRDGGHVYTIQIEPQLLRVLESGTDEIFSEVPPELNVRRYRIKVGTGPLPRDAGVPATTDPTPPIDSELNLAPYRDVGPGEPAPAERGQPNPGATGEPEFPPPPSDNSPSDWPPPEDSASDGLNEDFLGSDAAPSEPQVPAKLPPAGQASGPIEQARFDEQPDGPRNAGPVETQRPELPDVPNRPWTVLVGSVVLLCCSLGANAYLGWIAWEARHRYRDAVAKFRTAS